MKFIIVLLFFIPNICMAEYCEYKELPMLKGYSAVNESSDLFERGIGYCIESKLFEESFFYNANIEYCANPFTYEKPIRDIENYINKAYPNREKNTYMDKVVNCYKITHTPAYIEEVINIVFKYRLGPYMPSRILVNQEQSKYYNTIKEHLYTRAHINITEDYEWVKSSGSYFRYNKEKLIKLSKYKSEILLIQQLLFALCIDKRNPYITFFNPVAKTLPKVDNKMLEAVYEYVNNNPISFEEYSKNNVFSNMFFISICNSALFLHADDVFSILDKLIK